MINWEKIVRTKYTQMEEEMRELMVGGINKFTRECDKWFFQWFLRLAEEVRKNEWMDGHKTTKIKQ